MLTIINDTHNGVIRSNGTTERSALELRKYVIGFLADMLKNVFGDLMILGDLFDKGTVPSHDFLATYHVFMHWLNKHPDNHLILVAGNHDLHKNSSNLSSCKMLAKLLQATMGNAVQYVEGAAQLPKYNGYIISHVPNQDLFNLELAKVPPCDYLFLHCNYDNNFAVKSDHSLNLSIDLARTLPVKHIVMAHEHQKRVMMNGKVQIMGNQIPTSISDCLGNYGDKKYLHQINEAGQLIWTSVCDIDIVFDTMDWKKLVHSQAKFIRINGSADATEAKDAVAAIAKYRYNSDAFVVGNSVKVATLKDGKTIETSLEDVQSFNVLTALLACLDEKEGSLIKSLMEKHSVASA